MDLFNQHQRRGEKGYKVRGRCGYEYFNEIFGEVREMKTSVKEIETPTR